MYLLKQLPEDFIVKELIDLNLNPQGKYIYFKLTKKNFSTPSAISFLSNKWNKKISFAGLKDKIAITEQFCSVQGVSKDKISLDLHQINSFIKTEFIGIASQPISLGDHKGNYFEITVRNINQTINRQPLINNSFTNLFGEQRFSKNNSQIGEALVKRDFKTAINLIIKNHEHYKHILEIKDNNYISALRKLPKKLLLFYLNAFQSKIWNELAQNYANDYTSIPLIGFGTSHKLFNNLPYKPKDFIFKEFPELSMEGNERQTKVKALNLKISNLENDELNKGMKKLKLQFELPKGSYATEFVRQNFSLQ